MSVPPALEQALKRDAKARARFAALSYCTQKALALPIEQAKTDETRDRRRASALKALRAPS